MIVPQSRLSQGRRARRRVVPPDGEEACDGTATGGPVSEVAYGAAVAPPAAVVVPPLAPVDPPLARRQQSCRQ